jgi:hypothetical protein
MKRVLACLLLCAACTPLSLYYKPGVSVRGMEQDTLACQVEALDKAPVANQLRQEPPIYVPPRQICNSHGACHTRPGHWVQGAIYTVDVNEPLRKRVEQSCMARKGYAPAQIPVCSSDVKRAAPPGQTTRLPALTENSCVIRNDDGSFQIVNAG